MIDSFLACVETRPGLPAVDAYKFERTVQAVKHGENERFQKPARLFSSKTAQKTWGTSAAILRFPGLFHARLLHASQVDLQNPRPSLSAPPAEPWLGKKCQPQARWRQLGGLARFSARSACAGLWWTLTCRSNCQTTRLTSHVHYYLEKNRADFSNRLQAFFVSSTVETKGQTWKTGPPKRRYIVLLS